MSVRQDKFKVGDQVTYFDDYWATLVGSRKKFGKGPFTIEKVIKQPSSSWRKMGHTQHVVIADTEVCHQSEFARVFSGAFFKLVDTTIKQESE